jgi:hypothetical protein
MGAKKVLEGGTVMYNPGNKDRCKKEFGMKRRNNGHSRLKCF